jgi:hypothetical protein
MWMQQLPASSPHNSMQQVLNAACTSIGSGSGTVTADIAEYMVVGI